MPNETTQAATAATTTPVAQGQGTQQAETAGATSAGQGGQVPAADGAKKQTVQGSDANKADGAGKAPGSSAPLAVKLPEGLEVDRALLDSFTTTAAGLGLTQEQAQKIADAYVASAGKAAEKGEADRKAALEGWEKQIREDKDFGGANFDASMAAAKRAIAQFGTPGLQQLFDSTGWGSHPEMFRFAVKVGKGLAEDSVAGTGGNGSKTGDQEQVLRSFYPKMYEQKGM